MFPNSQVKRNPKRQTTMWAYWTFVKMKVNITCHNKNILKGKNRYSCCIFSSTSSFGLFVWIVRQTIPFHISVALWSKVNILIRIALGKKKRIRSHKNLFENMHLYFIFCRYYCLIKWSAQIFFQRATLMEFRIVMCFWVTYI